MGKSPKKAPQPTFAQRNRRRVLEARVTRVIKEPVAVGFTGDNRFEPASFWWNGEAYPVLRVVKRWHDEWRNTYFRVKTDRGLFDIYEHKKVISLAEQKYESLWYVAAELEMFDPQPRKVASTPGRKTQPSQTKSRIAES